MRGRKPRAIALCDADLARLKHIARCRSLPWFQVQRARILLGMAAGQRVGALAAQMLCDPATVWRLRRRYEEGGLERALAESPRPGKPLAISPPAARPDRAVGLP